MASDNPGTVGAEYGLSRDNFILDPVVDTKCFARSDIRTQDIAQNLDFDVVTGLAPKRLVWGPYGGGKTHTLMRTMGELAALTSVHPVRIECPDLSKRARFHDLYREGIMRALGQQFIIGLMRDVVGKVGFARPEVVVPKLREAFGDEELAKAAERLYDPNFEDLKLWRWISGVPMSRADLDDLQQSQDLTQTEAARLADIVVLFGRLLRDLRQRTLVLILDEMDRLKSIGAETVTTFVSGFTRLVDPNQRSVCVLIGASAAVESEMVEIFSTGSPVASRLGPHAMIEIPSLPEPDIDHFIRGVIGYLRMPDFNVATAVDAAQKSGVTEELTSEFFPFTTEAVDALKSRMQALTPRAITMQMTRALGRAYRRRSPAITAECVN